MYDVSKFVMPDEVKAFQDDDNLRGEEWNGDGWHMTAKWVPVFQKHKAMLEPIAESGSAWAQYATASIYMCCLLHPDEDTAMKAAENDNRECTQWLLMAARQGFLPALDNLGSVGVGSEADRIRALTKSIKFTPDQNTDDIQLLEKAWVIGMKELYRLAFSGKDE